MEKIVEVGGKQYRAVVKEYHRWSFEAPEQNVRGIPASHREEAKRIAETMVNHGEVRFFPVKGQKA